MSANSSIYGIHVIISSIETRELEFSRGFAAFSWEFSKFYAGDGRRRRLRDANWQEVGFAVAAEQLAVGTESAKLMKI